MHENRGVQDIHPEKFIHRGRLPGVKHLSILTPRLPATRQVPRRSSSGESPQVRGGTSVWLQTPTRPYISSVINQPAAGHHDSTSLSRAPRLLSVRSEMLLHFARQILPALIHPNFLERYKTTSKRVPSAPKTP